MTGQVWWGRPRSFAVPLLVLYAGAEPLGSRAILASIGGGWGSFLPMSRTSTGGESVPTTVDAMLLPGGQDLKERANGKKEGAYSQYRPLRILGCTSHNEF